MGWEVAEGPEVEHEWFNFDALNFGGDHPAREMQDTLFVEPAGQRPGAAHPHLAGAGPLAARPRAARLRRLPRAGSTAPTRSTRRTRRSSRQVEGLCVDEGITMAHLRGTLDHFAAGDVRRGHRAPGCGPSYFPFTEPSAELDLQCFACRGASAEPGAEPCRVCSSEGWIEWGGCGMVNPAVLRACGVDPERYSGFAFGMGLDRTLMFRHGITDIRDFYEGDQRFTLAFGMEA